MSRNATVPLETQVIQLIWEALCRPLTHEEHSQFARRHEITELARHPVDRLIAAGQVIRDNAAYSGRKSDGPRLPLAPWLERVQLGLGESTAYQAYAGNLPLTFSPDDDF